MHYAYGHYLHCSYNYIPGAWLLDDAGICFYEKSLKSREISDIDSVSRFFLSLISGLFGFTAITSFFQLFVPMFRGLDVLIANLKLLSTEYVHFGVITLILALIIYPILSGLLIILAAQSKMEINFDKNVRRILKRLIKLNIDISPVDLSVVLEKKKKPWYPDLLKDEKNKKNVRKKDLEANQPTMDNSVPQKSDNMNKKELDKIP
ncbi:MAG: hypothetical protein ACTSRZ_18980 [Promethearchaeota archaeon]